MRIKDIDIGARCRRVDFDTRAVTMHRRRVSEEIAKLLGQSKVVRLPNRFVGITKKANFNVQIDPVLSSY